MKSLSRKSTYAMHLVNGENGMKSDVFIMTLHELFEMLADIEDVDQDKTYLNILYQVEDNQITTDDILKIPMFRLSTILDLIEDHKVEDYQL